MATMVTVNCRRCNNPFQARVADRNRGWGVYCSKSCKAIYTKGNRTKKRKSNYKRHDGLSPMMHKFCHCGENAVNGLHTITGIEWLCAQHIHENDHPFSCEGLGQWL